jgi:hypothetical protein
MLVEKHLQVVLAQKHLKVRVFNFQQDKLRLVNINCNGWNRLQAPAGSNWLQPVPAGSNRLQPAPTGSSHMKLHVKLQKEKKDEEKKPKMSQIITH